MSFTLKMLAQLKESRERWKPSAVESPVVEQSDSQIPAFSIHKKLQLIIQQIQFGLPVSGYLEADPDLAKLVKDVLLNLPITHPSHPIRLYQAIYAPIKIEDNQYALEIHANVGSHQGKPQIFEWGLRSPELIWQDYVKLWATCQQQQCQPHELSLEVLALRSKDSPLTQSHPWSLDQHRQTENWIRQLILDPTASSPLALPNQDPVAVVPNRFSIDLDSVPEVAL